MVPSIRGSFGVSAQLTPHSLTLVPSFWQLSSNEKSQQTGTSLQAAEASEAGKWSRGVEGVDRGGVSGHGPAQTVKLLPGDEGLTGVDPSVPT